MEVLVLDGKNYVKATKAAKDLGYATDYVGQLCRGGHVDAHLIGRTWYVNQDELSTHKVEKKRQSRIKAREYAKKAIAEHKLKVQQTPNIYKNIDIQYESDTEDLIPKTKKVNVRSEPVQTFIADLDDDSPKLTYENEGEKVLMSGDLNVVDVTDEIPDPDTIHLSPRILRKQTPSRAKHDDIQEVVEGATEKKNFLDRLQETDQTTLVTSIPEDETTIVPVVTEDSVEPIDNAETQVTLEIRERELSAIPHVLFTGVIFCLTILSLCLEQVHTYQDQASHSIRFDYGKVVTYIEKTIKI